MSSSPKPTEERDTPIAVTVSSVPVNNTPMVYAQPYGASQTPYSPYSEEQRRAATSSYYVILPFRGANDFDEQMLMASALARSMKLLAIFDLVLLLLLSIFNLFYLLGIWGPICGYYGAKFFKNHLVFVYAAYWAIRTVFDFALVLSGYWWFILSLIIDMYIFSYVWTFARLLGTLSGGELNRLQSPPEPDELLIVSNNA
jgi:hypothetical protein